MTSKLISKQTKKKLRMTWSVCVRHVNSLNGAVKTEEGWRRRNNDELENLMRREERVKK
jgi:hypothetical protein